MTLVVAFVALLLATVNAGALASASVGGASAFGSGTVHLTSSTNRSILPPMENMKPGDHTSGDVTLSNTGTAAGTLWLNTTGLDTTPGTGGGDLARFLRLTVTEPGSGAVVYDGSMAGLTSRALGRLGAAQARSFRFTVTFPAGVGNAVQGGRTSVDFAWTLVQAS